MKLHVKVCVRFYVRISCGMQDTSRPYAGGRHACIARSLARLLHCVNIESSVYYGNRTCYEFCGVAHQVMYCSAKFFRVAHASERCLMYYVASPLGVRAVRIGQQCAVLFCDEEAWGYCVYAYSLTEFLCAFSCHEGCEIADAGLCGCISAYTCDGAEGSH